MMLLIGYDASAWMLSIVGRSCIGPERIKVSGRGVRHTEDIILHGHGFTRSRAWKS